MARKHKLTPYEAVEAARNSVDKSIPVVLADGVSSEWIVYSLILPEGIFIFII
jgi:hypothetical protein